MAKPEDSAPENGKPVRSQPPVIRKLVVAEEDSTQRLLKCQVPAWVISGLIHVALVGVFWLFITFFEKPQEAKGKTEPPTSTKIDDKPEKDPDLTNPDQGLDSDLNASTEAEKESDNNVEAPSVENEANGLPNHEKDFASQTANLGQFANSLEESGSMNSDLGGNIIMGKAGSGGALALPGLQGRSGATKERLLKNGGGNDATEAAVGKALAWLAKQQNSAGYWEFDGGHKQDRIAATGMCLLPFLAAGETHVSAKKYKDTVLRGINYLKAQIKANGQFGGAGMYSQAIASVAVCEAAGMTRDGALKKVAASATDFIIQAQAGDGSWGYTAGTNGDTSIVGWQVQALKSAKLAQIPVPAKCFEQAGNFLESVSGDSGATYGYRTKGSTHTLTAVALLSRQYMGWTPRNPSLSRGVAFLWEKFPPKKDDFNMYYYYYATQVVHFMDGPVWHRDWNPIMRGMLLEKQITEKTPGSKQSEIGSWPKDNGHIGSGCGKLGTTALACLTLEVYYRHLPLYNRAANGAE